MVHSPHPNPGPGSRYSKKCSIDGCYYFILLRDLRFHLSSGPCSGRVPKSKLLGSFRKSTSFRVHQPGLNSGNARQGERRRARGRASPAPRDRLLDWTQLFPAHFLFSWEEAEAPLEFGLFPPCISRYRKSIWPNPKFWLKASAY